MTLLYYSFFFFLFFQYIKQRCEPSSKLRPPLPRADRPLLRVRGRTLSVHADMPTMNIQISLKFHAINLRRLKSVAKLQRFGTERDIPPSCSWPGKQGNIYTHTTGKSSVVVFAAVVARWDFLYITKHLGTSMAANFTHHHVLLLCNHVMSLCTHAKFL